MTSKKIIGIPMFNIGENSVGCTKPYLEYFKSFGTIVLLSPDTFIPDLDLLVLPGGKDVSIGNEDFSFYNSDNERFLEHFDKFTLPKYIESVTPIFGVCRGFQTLAKTFGIPIIQNIWWNHGYSKDESDTKAHDITYLKYLNVKEKSPKIGSWHHQGVSVEEVMVNGTFDIIAHSTETPRKDYQIVEYMEHKNLPIIATQSHPERNQTRFDEFLINSLLEIKQSVK